MQQLEAESKQCSFNLSQFMWHNQNTIRHHHEPTHYINMTEAIITIRGSSCSTSTHTHTHTHTHWCTDVQIHAWGHTETCTHTSIHTHTHTYTHTQSLPLSLSLSLTHTHTHNHPPPNLPAMFHINTEIVKMMKVIISWNAKIYIYILVRVVSECVSVC